jgi:beta-N-acetylhexosaminidase
MRSSRFIAFILLTFFLFSINPIQALAQNGTVLSMAGSKVNPLIENLSPEQKVGQLFLVTFEGNEISANSKTVDLITNHHIGGVILKRENNNFASAGKTLESVVHLISSLQDTAAGINSTNVTESLQATAEPVSTMMDQAYIPLFVGISQEGDSYPYDQILYGVSPLPNEMAIGATWDPVLAEKVGNVLGKELHLLGFNLLIGPSLDVLDITYSGSGDDLGTRTFGSDPFWVSQLGRAYIRGIHGGSDNQIAVVAKHFPGRGGSDRLPESEVATVRKSLDQLRLIELAPFFAVTGNAREAGETAEGLYLSHIRYQGLQGNIRSFTKPISLDPAALGLLMDLPEFARWRKGGGIIVSDDLGSQAIRRSYDPTGKSFDARQVVLNAFLAGNDLLFMDRIINSDDPDSYTTILKVLDYFVQKYREDRAFAARVDASVARLLSLKYKIYPSFEINLTKPHLDLLDEVGKDEKVAFEVANKSITLLSPEKRDFQNALPLPPNARSNIVFFTDQVIFTQCSQCKNQAVPLVDEFRSAVIKLYGPGAGGQVNPNRLSSYTLKDLNDYLDAPLSRLDLESNLNKADWLIFSLLTPDSNQPSSNALHRLISERQQLIRDKKIIAFALNIPYRLDATDISNLTAFYGVFSKINSFIDVAARVIFQEITAQGASPVSVPGIAYDINTATSPNPQQTITLEIDWSEEQPQKASDQPTPAPVFFIGDTIPIKTAVILDHNGHQVPDGTVVKFIFNLAGEKRVSQQIESVSRDGIARMNYRIQDPGFLEIKVSSDPAFNSDILVLEITPGKSIVFSAITPTAIPTSAADQAIASDNRKTSSMKFSSNYELKLEWVVIILFSSLVIGTFIFLGMRKFTIQWGIQAGLSSVIGGFLSYLWVILELPGSSLFSQNRGLVNTIMIASLGACLGFICFLVWSRSGKKEK